MVMPAVTAGNNPDKEPTVAIEVLVLTQLPLPESVNIVFKPAQTEVTPAIVSGFGLMVMVVVVITAPTW